MCAELNKTNCCLGHTNSIDKMKIKSQVTIAWLITGMSLLFIGIINTKLMTDKEQVGNTIIAISAMIIAIPIFKDGLLGVMSRKSDKVTEQLISIVILASIISGNYIIASIVPLIMLVGHYLEQRSVVGTQEAIKHLKRLSERKVTIIKDGKEEKVEISNLNLGDIILVRPSEIISTDGEILEGISSVNQASITGESIPIEVKEGSHVFAGTINLVGLIKIKVTGIGNNTVLGKVQNMLDEAVQAKTPIIKIIEKYASYYLPIIISVFGIVLFVTEDINRGIAILIASCPCALVLSSPSAIMAGLAVASRMSVLIKNTKFLEVISEIDTLLLDKTGTVTLGELKVTNVKAVAGFTENEVIMLAAQCGVGSMHPVSRAVVGYAEQRGFDIHIPNRIKEEPGKGTYAETDNGIIKFGRRDWISKEKVEHLEIESEGCTVTWLSKNEKVIGAVWMSDVPRPDAKESLNKIRSFGIKKIVMITGDKKEVAERIAGEMNFDEVFSEVLPEEKLKIVNNEKANNKKVMMIGDGVNDALALATADVGVTIGLETMINEVALASADVAFLSNSLKRLPQMMILAKKIRWIIKQNLFVSLCFSCLMMILAVFGVLNPFWTAILHNGGVILVLINSSRIIKIKEATLNM